MKYRTRRENGRRVLRAYLPLLPGRGHVGRQLARAICAFCKLRVLFPQRSRVCARARARACTIDGDGDDTSCTPGLGR